MAGWINRLYREFFVSMGDIIDRIRLLVSEFVDNFCVTNEKKCDNV